MKSALLFGWSVGVIVILYWCIFAVPDSCAHGVQECVYRTEDRRGYDRAPEEERRVAKDGGRAVESSGMDEQT